MKVISNRFHASSIAVKKELYDLLQQEADYNSQIPKRFESFQSKPKPYFILEEESLKVLVTERKHTQMQLKQPNKEIVEECEAILKLLRLFKPKLIFVSLTA